MSKIGLLCIFWNVGHHGRVHQAIGHIHLAKQFRLLNQFIERISQDISDFLGLYKMKADNIFMGKKKKTFFLLFIP